MSELPQGVELVSHSVQVRFVGPVLPVVEQMLGNGLRRIEARTATVTVHPDGWRYVTFHGQQILRSGQLGSIKTVGWSVGAPYATPDPPPLALVLASSVSSGDGS